MELNSDQYITDKLHSETPKEQLTLAKLSIKLGLQSLWYGRKWIIYVILGILPLIFTVFSADPLFGADTVEEGFVDTFYGQFYLFLFSIGCLLIALTVSSDEISDHIIELYLVRPIKRETIWNARWVVVHIGIFVVNAFITLIYFVYYHMFDPEGRFSQFFDTLDLLVKAWYLVFLLTLTYGGLYLLVGFLGNRGFTFGVLIAIMESFFISLFFLSNSIAIPRTHYLNIFDHVMGSFFTYEQIPENLTLAGSYLYLGLFAVSIWILGFLYLRRKEFN